MAISLSLILLFPFVLGLGLLLKSLPILQKYHLSALLGSGDWSPAAGHFGFYPFIISSVWVTVLSFLIAAPICLLAAIYLTQYARSWMLKGMHLVIDILAGIPSVVYGVWGVLVVVPFISTYLAPAFGKTSAGYSILAGAVVLAIMSIPYILNMLIGVFQQIPVELKEASLTLGATEWETIRFVLLKEGLPGIIAAFGLGISKALGETIAVLMVVGNMVQAPHGLFDAGYPLPALIANNYGDMMSIPLYDSALMLSALLLFVIILIFNLFARILLHQYDTR